MYGLVMLYWLYACCNVYPIYNMYGLLLHHNGCMFSILCIVCIPDSCMHVMTSYYMYIRLVCCALASALCIDLSRTNSILTAPVQGHYSGEEQFVTFMHTQ